MSGMYRGLTFFLWYGITDTRDALALSIRVLTFYFLIIIGLRFNGAACGFSFQNTYTVSFSILKL